jgi:Glycosyl transferase family 2
MREVTIVLLASRSGRSEPFSEQPHFANTLSQFSKSPFVDKIIVLHNRGLDMVYPKSEFLKTENFGSGRTVRTIFNKISSKYVLLLFCDADVILGDHALQRFISVARQSRAGVVYADYVELKDGKAYPHPVNECQLGSVRDNFDFGPLYFFSAAAVRQTLKRYSISKNLAVAGWYDLRLKMSVHHNFFHIQEYLYTIVEGRKDPVGERQFDYVDPRNRSVQKEMELVVTKHLKTIDAYLAPKFKRVTISDEKFPVHVSVIIPVRNREKTIAEAIESALSQCTDFSFNIIVVDNHSTDGTTGVVKAIAERHANLIHIVPLAADLAIGGCWNEAIFSEHCGRYAVQLDSDDLYSGPDTLQKIVEEFKSGNYAMIIGSYKLVNMKLEEIPPGLIDHKEWSEKNGRNNALRVNGLGAPRAFDTTILRKIGFPNVSYGEDYTVALALSREFQIGRIYECLYLCRRWEGNSDSALTIEKANRNDFYKDKIRTLEILARQQINKHRKRKG